MNDDDKEVQPQEQTEEDDCSSVDAEVLQGEAETPLTDKELAEKYLANWQRSQADFANYKRRAEQEKSEFVKFANSNLMSGLLPIIDDFQRALENVDQTADPKWVEGIELIYKKLMSHLESQGLCEIGALGEEFDPNCHEAVLHEEGEEGKVIEELQKGYKLHDRLLRPSMVKVGKGIEES